MKLPITRPIMGEAEIQALQGPLKSGWLVQGPQVKKFESLFASFVRIHHAVATST